MNWVDAARARVAGRTVLVTGASSGIGRATALDLAPSGATFVLLARRTRELERVAAQITGLGGVAHCVTADLGQRRCARDAGDHIVASWGVPDAVVAAAGVSVRRGVLPSMRRFEVYERSMSVNFLGTLALIAPLLIGMAERGSGTVVGVTSAAARIPLPTWSPYAASKAAFDAWLGGVRPELGRHGVRVCRVALPLVDTPMIAQSFGRGSRLAMPVERAASWVCRAVATGRSVGPWWLPLAQAVAGAAPDMAGRIMHRSVLNARP